MSDNANNRVVVTGIGMVSPLGLESASNWEALKAGKSGIDTIKSFDVSKYSVRFAGEVKGFETGGTIPAPNPTVGTSTSSSLSPWAGPYVTNLLSRGEAVAQGPYQAYQGPLTAGASDLQQQAFSGIQSLAGAGYTPTTFTSGTFGSEQAQQYMNPYIQAALNPQLAEMKRQSDIARLDDTSRLAKAGAFGGSRQAIM